MAGSIKGTFVPYVFALMKCADNQNGGLVSSVLQESDVVSVHRSTRSCSYSGT